MAREEMRPATTTVHDLPDTLLGLVLQRLASPIWLVHAAATCRRWRRLVTTSCFLQRLVRAGLGQHHVAGNYHNRVASGRGGPAFVPSSAPAPAPAVVVDRRRFSLDFLPGGSESWELVDSRRSVLLLAKRKTGWMRRCFPDLVVCEPVTRRYLLIPRMQQMKRHRCVGAFLYGCDAVAAGWCTILGSMSTFVVVCVLYQEYAGVSDGVGTVTACSFRRRWHADDTLPPSAVHLRGAESLHFLGRTDGALSWSIKGDEESVLIYNGAFRIFWLPELIRGSSLRFMDHHASDHYGKMRVVSLQGSKLSVFTKSRSGHGVNEWVLEKSLPLMEATRGLTGHREEYFDDGGGALEIVAAGVTSVVLVALATKTWLFSVDLDTMEVAECRYGKTNNYASAVAYPCELPWPGLHACKVRCRSRGSYPCSRICICR